MSGSSCWVSTGLLVSRSQRDDANILHMFSAGIFIVFDYVGQLHEEKEAEEEEAAPKSARGARPSPSAQEYGAADYMSSPSGSSETESE